MWVVKEVASANVDCSIYPSFPLIDLKALNITFTQRYLPVQSLV